MKNAPHHNISDAILLARYKADGDSKWLGVLLQRYTLLLFGVCFKYLKNEEEAKDAVQQIFLKVLTEADRFTIEFFKAWLYTVAKNFCLMRLREKGAKRQLPLTENLVLVHEDLKMVDVQQEEAAYLYLEAALHQLPLEQQTCVKLFYLEKMSYQQVSAATGYTLLQVKSFIQNGKRNLKRAIEKKEKLSD